MNAKRDELIEIIKKLPEEAIVEYYESGILYKGERYALIRYWRPGGVDGTIVIVTFPPIDARELIPCLRPMTK